MLEIFPENSSDAQVKNKKKIFKSRSNEKWGFGKFSKNLNMYII